MTDESIRTAAFSWLANQVEIHGEVLPWTLLAKGFEYQGVRIPLVSQQGIFKPKAINQGPLSIRTSVDGPYDDAEGDDGLLRYRYRGTDPELWDNVALRLAWKRGIPLVYFLGIERGKYLAVWPVYVVGDNPRKLTFTIAVDDRASLYVAPNERPRENSVQDVSGYSRREYITRLTRFRVHQHSFRARVLRAYRSQCACCRLRHDSLLDAAHIIADKEPEGEPRVSNGLALCKLHHAAFDSDIFGITPDYIVKVRLDVLEEHDGPMLLHGLQGIHEKQIILPQLEEQRPDRTLLEKRFDRFRRAG